jgi:predicted metal-dependent hydrolase
MRQANMDATAPTTHDPRYLAGIVLFNRGDFFEAHEVWESLWMETHGPERPFLQGLIQAAVGLCHFCNGNVRGAAKLYRSSHDYMERFGPRFWDMDLARFWTDMHACFAELLALPEPERRVDIKEELIPEINLDPVPETWPDPSAFLDDDHAS